MTGEGIAELEALHRDLAAQAETVLSDHQERMRELYGRIEELNQRFYEQQHENMQHAFVETLRPRLDMNDGEIERLKSMYNRMCHMERAFALIHNQYHSVLCGDQNEDHGKENNLGFEFSVHGDK